MFGTKKYWIIFLVTAFLVLIFSIWSVVYPFVFGFLASFFLQPVVVFLERYKINRKYGIPLVTLAFVCVFVVFFMVLVPSLLKETYNLVSNLKEHLQVTQTIFTHLADFIIGLGIPLRQDQIVSHLSNQLNQLIAPFFSSTITSLISVVQDIVIIIILVPLTVFYILKDRAALTKMINSYFSEKTNVELKQIYHDCMMRMKGYLNSLLLSAFLNTIFMLILLLAWNVKYAFALAFFSGILYLIPYLGILIQVIVIALIQMSSGASIPSMFWLAVVQLGFSSFMGLYLQPKFTSMTMKTHPLFVIFAVMVGGYFYGITGMVFSIPIMIILQTAFEISVSKNNIKLEIKE